MDVRDVTVMTILLSFKDGVTVRSSTTGKVLQRFPGGAYVDVKGGRLLHHEMTEDEWLSRELTGAPPLSMTQTAMMRSAKQRLVDIASRPEPMPRAS